MHVPQSFKLLAPIWYRSKPPSLKNVKKSSRIGFSKARLSQYFLIFCDPVILLKTINHFRKKLHHICLLWPYFAKVNRITRGLQIFSFAQIFFFLLAFNLNFSLYKTSTATGHDHHEFKNRWRWEYGLQLLTKTIVNEEEILKN